MAAWISVRGKDYVYPGGVTPGLPNMPQTFSGVAPFRHDDSGARPARVFGGRVTLHTGPDRQAYVLLPVVPPKEGA